VTTLAVAAVAVAEVRPYPPEGGMVLTIDWPTGATTLTNESGAPLDVDGYEIWSVAGNLDPDGWISISDRAIFDPLLLLAWIGPGSLSFGELNATPTSLAEASLSSWATFQSGAPWDIGNPVLPHTASLEDLSFYYKTPDIAGDKIIGRIDIVPEPATMSLLAAGGLALVRRKRR
jgi:hypothetical protein